MLMRKQRWWARVTRFWDGLFSFGDGWLGKRRRHLRHTKKRAYSPSLEQLEDRRVPVFVGFSSGDYTVDEFTSSKDITVILSASSSLTVTVQYSTSNGTATAGSDYTSVSGTLTFSPGE